MNNSDLKISDCMACGSSDCFTFFENKTLERKVKDRVQEVSQLKGKQCKNCKGFFLDADSHRRYAEAGDVLVKQVRHQPHSYS